MLTKVKDLEKGDEVWVKCKVTYASTTQSFVCPVGMSMDDDDIEVTQSSLDGGIVKTLSYEEKAAKLNFQLEAIKEKIRCLER